MRAREIESSLVTIEMSFAHPGFSEFYRDFMSATREFPQMQQRMEQTRRRIVRSVQGTGELDEDLIAKIATGLAGRDQMEVEVGLDKYRHYCEGKYMETGEEVIDRMAVDRLAIV